MRNAPYNAGEPTPAPLRGRLNDLQIAQEWADATRGDLFFYLSPDSKSAEWYRIEAGNRTPRNMHDTEIDALILEFMQWLISDGAQIRISATKVSAVRRLAVLLRVKTRHAQQHGGHTHHA